MADTEWYVLKSTTSTDGSTNIKLWIGITPSYNSSTRTTTTKLSLCVNSNYTIGPWGDFSPGKNSSQLHNTKFSGAIPSTKGDYYIISDVTGPSYQHDDYGNTTAQNIYWYWGVNSSWGKFQHAKGNYSYKPASQAALATYTITYNANGGTGGPANGTKTQGRTYYIAPETPVKSGYSFTGWKSSGGTWYSAGDAYNTDSPLSLTAQWSKNVDYVGLPSALAITDNGNNSVTVSCKVGANNTANTATGVDFYVTFDGRDPYLENYDRVFSALGLSAGATASVTFSIDNWSTTSVNKLLGTDHTGIFKVKARTRGSAGALYFSDLSASSSATVTWHSAPNPVPSFSSELENSSGCLYIRPTDYLPITWTPATATADNGVGSYELKIYNVRSGALVTTYNETGTSILLRNILSDNQDYYAEVVHIGANGGRSTPNKSCLIKVRNISSFSDNFSITPYQFDILPTTVISGSSDTIMLNSGKGKICGFGWPEISASNNSLLTYRVNITNTQNAKTYTFDTGLKTDFVLTAEMLKTKLYCEEGTFRVAVQAKSVYGSSFDSNIAYSTIKIKRCSPVFIDVPGSQTKKRAVPFVKTTSGNWKLVSNTMVRPSGTGSWSEVDIMFEKLLDTTDNVITDINNNEIYILI